MRRTIGTMVMAATLATALPAQAACWTARDVRAAAVRDLDTMLMVAALRCRTGEQNFMNAYNDFVVASRPALTEINRRLRDHFAYLGDRGALDAADRYVTRIANRYGAGVAGLGCDDMASIVAAAKAEGSNPERLADLAERAGVKPEVDGPLCPVQMVAR